MSETFVKRAYRVPVSEEIVRADHPRFSFGIFRDPPGQLWANFVHDTDEFVVVVEGNVAIEVAGEQEQCGPGDLARIPAGARHTLRTSRAAGSVWFYGYGRFGAADG